MKSLVYYLVGDWLMDNYTLCAKSINENIQIFNNLRLVERESAYGTAPLLRARNGCYERILFLKIIAEFMSLAHSHYLIPEETRFIGVRFTETRKIYFGDDVFAELFTIFCYRTFTTSLCLNKKYLKRACRLWVVLKEDRVLHNVLKDRNYYQLDETSLVENNMDEVDSRLSICFSRGKPDMNLK